MSLTVEPGFYAVRSLRPDELPLVLSSWISSLRQDARRRRCDAARIQHDDYYRGERARAEYLISTSTMLVATVPEVPDEVLGWACVAPGVLHYAYTKAPFRRAGVLLEILRAAGLVPGGIRVTTMTADVLCWIRQGRPVTFDPYAALR